MITPSVDFVPNRVDSEAALGDFVEMHCRVGWPWPYREPRTVGHWLDAGAFSDELLASPSGEVRPSAPTAPAPNRTSRRIRNSAPRLSTKAGRRRGIASRVEASHGGRVVAAGDYSVEQVAKGQAISAFVFDANDKASVAGDLDSNLDIGAGRGRDSR